MDSFQIESYKVGFRVYNDDTNAGHERIIELRSEPLYHGIVVRAILHFSGVFGTGAWLGVFELRGDQRLLGYLPATEYSLWYDVLRAESPLTFSYDAVPYNADYMKIRVIELGSLKEPIGEGPADSSPYPEFIRRLRSEIYLKRGVAKPT
jgi:hypothetical protein